MIFYCRQKTAHRTGPIEDLKGSCNLRIRSHDKGRRKRTGRRNVDGDKKRKERKKTEKQEKEMKKMDGTEGEEKIRSKNKKRK